MKYAKFDIFEKSGKICNCCLLQIIGGVLTVKSLDSASESQISGKDLSFTGLFADILVKELKLI